MGGDEGEEHKLAKRKYMDFAEDKILQ